MQSQHTPAITLRSLPVLLGRAAALATLLFVVLFSIVGVSALAAADRFAPVGGSGFTAFRLVDERPEFVAVDSVGARRLADRGFVIAPASKLTLLDARFVSGVPANAPVLPAVDPSGVVVAVIDTGVDPNHSWFVNRLVPGQSFVGDPLDSSDGHGHGTHVAGIVSQTNPAARIMPIRAVNAFGHGTDQQVSAGIVWAVENGASVINLSLGGQGRSFALDTAVEYARSRNVVVVAAAGNMGEQNSPVMYPAAHDQVVAVAAVDSSALVAPFSNRGFYVDVAAPGVGIVSSLPGGGFGSMSGTSMATPYVSGVVAQLRALRSDLDAASVIRHVESTSRDVGEPGRDDVYGWGVVDAPRAMAEAGSLAAAPVAVSAGPLKLTQSPRPGSVLLLSKKPLASVSVYVDGALALKSDTSSKQWRVPLLTETAIVVLAFDVEGRPYDMLTMDASPKPVAAPKVGLSRSPSALKVTIKLPAVAGQVRLLANSEVGDVIDIVLPRPGKSAQVTYKIPTTRGLRWGVLVCLVSGSAEICSDHATSRR
jgi:subtilisin family serine protease